MIVCLNCKTPFEKSNTMGPTPKYCKRSCRQRAFEKRKLEKLIHELKKERL